MNRIEALRAEALDKHFCNDELFYKFYKSFFNLSTGSVYERYALAFFDTFDTLTPMISDGEIIVGKLSGNMTAEQSAEWEQIYKPQAFDYCKSMFGQDSHMSIDYDAVLTLGLSGISDKIHRYMKSAEGEQLDFYLAADKCLLAVIHYSDRYAAFARELAENEADPQRRVELLEIAEVCKRVPAYPSRSFREAVQCVHFITHCVSLNPLRLCYQQFQLGRPDRYLLPYYEKDIAEGRLTRDEAQLLLDCLGIQINLRVPSGLSSGYMVGGRDKDGKVVSNDLTRMLMQVVDDIRLVYPAVGLCYTKDTPDEDLTLAAEILSHGRSHPAIFNDDVIADGLQKWGIPPEDAYSYIHSTCVEITPIAASNVWVASPYTNMAQLLLDTMDREYPDFDAHLAELLSRLDLSIENNMNVQLDYRKTRAECSINPLLSCLVNDCLRRGTDIECGGARYNWIMPSFVGMANFVDSLFALKRIIYDDAEMTVTELKKILDNNFEGNESLRLRLLEQLPKYGNDNDEIDGYFGMMTEHILDVCKRLSEGLGEQLIPSVFCWIMHEHFGKRTGATPDGRLAGFPLGDGSGPCQGREMCGPTASILSSTKWGHGELIGGVAVNMKFSKSNLGHNSIDTMIGLIRAFIARGGFEIQINVTDKAILEDARKNPDLHRDLIVRIGGYSDYFTRLNPGMQEEIILRTEHSI